MACLLPYPKGQTDYSVLIGGIRLERADKGQNMWARTLDFFSKLQEDPFKGFEDRNDMIYSYH